MAITFANESICGKSVRIIRASSHKEFFGQTIFEIYRQVVQTSNRK